MNSSVDSENKIFQKLSQQLLEKKGLQTITQNGAKGGFGLVLFVEDIKTKQRYAVKAQSIIDQTIGGIDDDKFEQCKIESEILKTIKHKNIVEYHSDYTIGFYHFIQMNLCECSLDDWIQKRGKNKISQSLFLHFFNQILDGVEYLHSLNYVLRDLSARNILITADGVIKLCDFGLAKKIETEIMASLIQSNNLKGVFAYYPPELIGQIENNSENYSQSKKGDIWALGICLSLLGGNTFFQVASFNQPEAEIKQAPLLDEVCNQIIQFILNPDPNQRPSISQIRKFVYESICNQQQIAVIQQDNQSQKKNQEKDCEYYNSRDLTVDLERFKQIEQECLQTKEIIESLLKLSYIQSQFYYNIDLAQSYLLEATQINDQDPDIYLNQALILIIKLSLGDNSCNDQIKQYLAKAEQICPNYWQIPFIRARFYYNNKEEELSFQQCQMALKLKKDSDELNFWNLYVQLNERSAYQFRYSIYLQMQYLKVKAKFKNYYHFLGVAADKNNELNKSLEYYKNELQYYQNPLTIMNIGVYYHNQLHLSLAKEYYQKSLEIYPNNKQCISNLLTIKHY